MGDDEVREGITHRASAGTSWEKKAARTVLPLLKSAGHDGGQPHDAINKRSSEPPVPTAHTASLRPRTAGRRPSARINRIFRISRTTRSPGTPVRCETRRISSLSLLLSQLAASITRKCKASSARRTVSKLDVEATQARTDLQEDLQWTRGESEEERHTHPNEIFELSTEYTCGL